MKQNLYRSIVFISVLNTILFVCLAGCSANSKYQNKKRLDTVKKDLNAVQSDIDTLLGIDDPSPLTEW
ncbi:MAG: hypothetical protein ACUBOA_11260 [Candidatus Loosdrechtia sp.]|uniref:hypothetical protein n=1 Tax=Candidatus Loosdrechtia sp. TaxID=3101272 RepID=UPI003A73450A|nr:MAG: hypothetical protein QY305_01805 [Candidatus Jettenia sp. AMX2]